MDNEHECSALIHHLKNLGIRISIDDFGTGYSSLAYLRNFAVDKIKIDRSFIKDIPETDNGMIANSIIQLSKNLNLKTIAEGVETKEHIQFLKDNKCTEAQGFYYSKPLSKEALIKYMQQKDEERK
jgi:EAL domain-containing protein (putative c-di-GMP-specific phosphodiesterase class I)